MAVLQMRKISICALKKDRDGIFDKLQALGTLQLTGVPETEGFSPEQTAELKSASDRETNLAEQALSALDLYAPVKRSVFASLEGRREVAGKEFSGIRERKEEILRKAERITALSKEITENRAQILKLENQAETLKPWLSLDVPMNARGTKKTAFIAGTMPAGTTQDSMYALLAEKCPEVEAFDLSIISQETDMLYVAAVCMKEEARKVEDALRSGGFARFWQDSDETPKARTAGLRDEIGKLSARNDSAAEEIRSMAGLRGDLEAISDAGRITSGQMEALGLVPQSEKTFVISGYCAAKDAPGLEKALAPFDCIFESEEVSEEDEEAPTILSNNAFSANMEGIVGSYGLPNRKELDPTTIMSFFYVFFFGMMLSDAAYGAIIAIACFIVLKKYPRMEKGMKRSIAMFFWCGISTLVWGLLFGGFFGDIVDTVSSLFFGKKVSIPALWFTPLNDPMRLLLYSMLFGLIHMFVGLGIKGVNQLRAGDRIGFFADVVCWYMFLLGLILMLLPSSLFASIAGQQIVLPAFAGPLSKVLTIAGMIGILLFTEREAKNPVLRLALGAYGIYGVTGWLSDVLSYSRLLALGLATGVIASVVNQMGSMAGGGVLGGILLLVVFLIGQTLNLAINLLGAYVHTNRLQFVEFFGKFYDGGGKPFEPFEADTKYIEIKED